MSDEIERLEAVSKIVENVKQSYPDVKKLRIYITFKYVEADTSYAVELCPVVDIDMER